MMPNQYNSPVLAWSNEEGVQDQKPSPTEQEFERLIHTDRISLDHRNMARRFFDADPKHGLSILKEWIQSAKAVTIIALLIALFMPTMAQAQFAPDQSAFINVWLNPNPPVYTDLVSVQFGLTITGSDWIMQSGTAAVNIFVQARVTGFATSPWGTVQFPVFSISFNQANGDFENQLAFKTSSAIAEYYLPYCSNPWTKITYSGYVYVSDDETGEWNLVAYQWCGGGGYFGQGPGG